MAGATFTLTLNSAATAFAFRRLKDRAPQCVSRALNRAITSTRKVMVDAVVNDLGMAATKVRDKIAIVPAYPEGNGLVAKLVTSKARIKLSEFDPKGPLPSRGRGRGVTVSMKIWGRRRRYPKLFLVQFRSGHLGVFARERVTTRRSQGAWSKNLPILEPRGPSMVHVARRFAGPAYAHGREQLVKNLRHEFRFAMGQTASQPSA